MKERKSTIGKEGRGTYRGSKDVKRRVRLRENRETTEERKGMKGKRGIRGESLW